MLLGARLSLFGGAQNPPSTKYDHLLDYVQGAGVKHDIEIPFNVRDITKVELRVCMDNATIKSGILSTSNGTNTTGVPLLFYIAYSRGSQRYYVGGPLQSGDRVNFYSSTDSSWCLNPTTCVITQSGYFTLGDTDISFTSSYASTILQPDRFYVLGGNAVANAKLYSFKLFTGIDNLVRDFRPAIKDNVACLWDAVTDELYYPTTGELIAGNPIS